MFFMVPQMILAKSICTEGEIVIWRALWIGKLGLSWRYSLILTLGVTTIKEKQSMQMSSQVDLEPAGRKKKQISIVVGSTWTRTYMSTLPWWKRTSWYIYGNSIHFPKCWLETTNNYLSYLAFFPPKNAETDRGLQGFLKWNDPKRLQMRFSQTGSWRV